MAGSRSGAWEYALFGAGAALVGPLSEILAVMELQRGVRDAGNQAKKIPQTSASANSQTHRLC